MSGKAVRETLGFLAVVAGLVFVGVEIQQNTSAIRGATYQALSDASSSYLYDVAGDPELATLLSRVFFEDSLADDFEASEQMRLWLYHAALVRGLENTFLQHAAGVVDDRVFNSYGWNDGMIHTPYFQEFWFVGGGSAVVAGTEFRGFFERRTGITPAEQGR